MEPKPKPHKSISANEMQSAGASLKDAPNAETGGGGANPALTADDIGEYLQKADDFAFEREVYHAAYALRFDAEHAALYSDPITGKQRQFDVRASYARDDNKISLAIECKGLTSDYPLLVSCVPRARDEAYHQILEVSDTSRSMFVPEPTFSRVKTVLSGRHPCIYPAGEPTGKSMRQVKRESQGKRRGPMTSGDDVFDKWSQSVASLAEMIESDAKQLRLGSHQNLNHAAFLPVLVVSDETLWVADYSSRGELQRAPFRVDSLTYYLGRQYALQGQRETLALSHLHIFTRSALRDWLQEIAQGGGIWQELFPSR